MDLIRFKQTYRITWFGLLGGLIFSLICLVAGIIERNIILPLFYIPGAIFGLAMTFALKKYSDSYGALFILFSLEYLAMIFFISINFEYLEIRRILMGGIGALLTLTTVRIVTNIKIDINDYIYGFSAGILTTFFMWTDNFRSFNPWLIILSILLWQTAIALIINRRQLILVNERK